MTRAVAAFVSAQLLATIWAVVYRLPYEVGGRGNPDQVLNDFWTRGTALSAPAPFLVVLGVLAFVARRPTRVGSAATALLIAVMGVGLVAGGANPVVRRALSAAMPLVPRVGIVLLSTLNYTAALLVLVVAVARLRNAMSTRHE